ncbi:MAG: protein kinase domain-containing protein [Sphaerospermopsis kisseleviana]
MNSFRATIFSSSPTDMDYYDDSLPVVFPHPLLASNGDFYHVGLPFPGNVPLKNPSVPDYGKIDLIQHKIRTIQEVDLEYERHRAAFLDSIDGPLISWLDANEAQEDVYKKCRDVQWAKYLFPTCNHIHEHVLERPVADDTTATATATNVPNDYNVAYLSHGYFRDSYLLDRNDVIPDTFVSKRYRLIDRHTWGAQDQYQVHQEAIIMEQLTRSPHILDIYGQCGTTVFVETMALNLVDLIVPGKGFGSSDDIVSTLEDGQLLYNNLTASEKLQLSLSMAEALADLHYFDGGVIVHSDVAAKQLLLSRNGHAKLNDFNYAVALQFNTQKQEYCPEYNRQKAFYRSPEELQGTSQDETKDTFALGIIIYSILTGLHPYYEEGEENLDPLRKEIRKEIIGGRHPIVDKRYRDRRKSSYIESSLVRIMEQCWAQKPHKRPSMNKVLKYLYGVRSEAWRIGEWQPSTFLQISMPVWDEEAHGISRGEREMGDTA